MRRQLRDGALMRRRPLIASVACTPPPQLGAESALNEIVGALPDCDDAWNRRDRGLEFFKEMGARLKGLRPTELS